MDGLGPARDLLVIFLCITTESRAPSVLSGSCYGQKQVRHCKSIEPQNGDVDVSEKDVYDFMLTQGEIQAGVNDINTAVKREIAEAKSELKVHYCAYKVIHGCFLSVRSR